jgi:hypothetical protein
LDPLSSHRVRQRLQLPWAFMMPSHGNRLKHKSFSAEAMDVLPFTKLLGGKVVTVGGKPAFYVWFVEPTTTVQPGFCMC